jgi:hypothetical protein
MNSLTKLTIIPDTRFAGDDMVEKFAQYQQTAHPLHYGYLHGDLEDLVGYDICMTLEPNEELEEGIYDADFDGMDCKLFWWKTHFAERYKGLVVLCTDAESMSYAQECYNNKMSSI